MDLMVWRAIVRKTDGTLVSVASVLPESLPSELEVVDLPRAIDWGVETWNPATRTIVPKATDPADIDRVNDFIGRATFLDARLTAAQRTQFRTILATFLGKQRFRAPSDPVDL